jgi:antitoxin component of MazEF toxin-antitoxin module
MAQQQITQVGHEAALVLPPDVLEQTELHIGDTIEISVVDGMLVVAPLHQAGRKHNVQEATRKVLARRHSAYQRLA